MRRAGLDEAPIPTQIAAAGTDAAADLGHAVGVGQAGDQGCRAALACAVRRRIDLDAPAVNDAVAGFEPDDAAVVDESGRLEAAGVVHHPALQTIRRLRRQNDQPARCLHRVAVVHQRRNGRRLDADVGQPVVVELQFIGLARRQHHGAQLRDDDAAVAHFGCEQGDVAIQVCRQAAFVLHLAGGTVAAEVEPARHEVVVADAVRRSSERTDIDVGCRAEVDAAAIGQEDLPVGGDAPEDLARVGIEHAVEYRRTARRLDEIDPGRTADVEGLPVDGGAVAALGDGECGRALSNARLPGHQFPAGGELRCDGRIGRRRKNRRRRQGDKAGRSEQHGTRGALAAGLGDFGDRHPGVGEVVPDQAIGLVHDVALSACIALVDVAVLQWTACSVFDLLAQSLSRVMHGNAWLSARFLTKCCLR